MRNIRNAFILGGTGYIGSYLVDHLSTGHDIRLSLLIHRTPPFPAWPDRIRYVYGTVADLPWRSWDRSDIPDVIFHFARIAGKRKIGRFFAARKSRQINQDLISWLQEQSSPPLLVLIAGSLAYGSSPALSIDEDTPLHPTGYARDYARGEDPVVAALASGLPVMVLRAPWVYGPRSWFQRFFYQPLQKQQAVPVYGAGQQWMSFIHVEDCAHLIFYLARAGYIGTTYNLFVGQAWRQRDFSSLLSRKTGLPLRPLSRLALVAKYGLAAAEALTFSCALGTKHQELLSEFEPLFPLLENGIEDVLSQSRFPGRFVK